MKITSFTLLAIFLCTASMAQVKKQKKHVVKPEATILMRKIMNAQSHSVAAKTTATNQRLIAEADYQSWSPTVADSFIFKYSGTRSSVFDPEFMTFTPGYNGPSYDHFYEVFGYDTYTGLPLLRNEAPVVMSDTTIIYSNIPSSTPTFGILATESKQYDGNNNLIDNTFIGHPDYFSNRDSMTYTSDGKIATITGFQWYDLTLPAYWQMQDRSHFSYNGAGQMIADSQSINSGGWIPQRKYTYSYDGSGNMTLAQKWLWDFPGYTLDKSYVMNYDGMGRLQTYKYYNHESGVAMLELQDSIGYTSGVSYATYFRVKEYDDTSLLWMDVITKNTSAVGKPDTIINVTYDVDSMTVYSSSMGVFAYNSYANPITMTTYYDNDVAIPTTVEGNNFYYYELFETSSTKELQATSGSKLSVYPNPVTDNLQLSITGTLKNQPVVVSISDLSGKIIKTIQLMKSDSFSVSVSELTNGIYLINASQNGQIIGSQKFVKELIVV